MEAQPEVSERHELAAAAMRQYGTDPDGVERAMLAAGFGAITAKASRDGYADFLRKNGYDVDGPGGMDAPQWALDKLSPAPSVPEPEVEPEAEPIPTPPKRAARRTKRGER